MEKALAQSGRKIALDTTEGAYDIAIAPELNKDANQWEYTPDVEECGGTTGLTAYPCDYLRFNSAALWQGVSGPGKGFDDLDSVEVGNGQTPSAPPPTVTTPKSDGLTLPGRETVLSLWSLAGSPLILGTDLRQLNQTENPVDLALLHNRTVVGIDQNGIAAKRVSVSADSQVFSKTEPNGDVVVGLFNTNSTQPQVVSTTAAQVGLAGAGPYRVTDIWGRNSDLCAAAPVLSANPTPATVQAPLCPAGSTTRYEAAGTISANVPAEGVAFYEIKPLNLWAAGPGDGYRVNRLQPSTTLDLSGVGRLTAGQPTTATETFTNNGVTAVGSVSLGLSAPAGFTVTSQSCSTVTGIAPGQTVTATFQVTASSADTNGLITATATSGPRRWSWRGRGCPPQGPQANDAGTQTTSVSDTTTVVSAPVVINEVQTGSTTTPNQQFVELYNAGGSSVDLSNWQLQYQRASIPRRGGTPSVLVTLPQGATIPAHGYYLIAGAGYAASSTQPASDATFTSSSPTALSSVGGGVGLVDGSGFVVDSVGWGVAENDGFAPSAFQRTSDVFVQNCSAQPSGVVPTATDPQLTALIPADDTSAPPSIPNGDSLVRLPDGHDTGSNCDDFTVTATPSPKASNAAEPHLSVIAPNPTISAGDPPPALTPTYSGLTGGDTAASLPLGATCTTTATRFSPPGSYPITCSGAADPKYDIDASSYVGGTLRVRGRW